MFEVKRDSQGYVVLVIGFIPDIRETLCSIEWRVSRSSPQFSEAALDVASGCSITLEQFAVRMDPYFFGPKYIAFFGSVSYYSVSVKLEPIWLRYKVTIKLGLKPGVLRPP